MPNYPKPGATGGRIIREIISLLRESGLTLPFDSHILIATSGGPDSIALAHLILKYGRRVVDPKNVSLIHVNHGWRGEESDADALFVIEFGAELGAKVLVRKLKSPANQGGKSRSESGRESRGQSWEDEARIARKSIFNKEAHKYNSLILTAHHADDLAETMVWRFFTGALATHGGGIAVKSDLEIRPLLRVRKRDLLEYLAEEGETWRDDSSNASLRFLRNRIRHELMPVVERLFPRAVEWLVKTALEVQKKSVTDGTLFDPVAALFGTAGVRARRPHWEAVNSKVGAQGFWKGTLDLADGWKLSGLKKGNGQRWMLQKSGK